MADDFSIDPSGFSLTQGESMDFTLPSDLSTILGGGGFDFGGSSFPAGINFGVPSLAADNPLLADPGNVGATLGNPQAGLQGFLQKLFGGGGQAGQQPGIVSQAAGVGLPALGVASGIGGIIQSLAGGRPLTSQQLRSTVQESPQQAQLAQQTLAALQNLQGLAHNAELQQAVSRLASGQLPISPDLVDQVTKAFGATAGGVATQSIENARQRGFSGGTELLGGAGSPQYAQSLAQLQSDVSQALVNLALGLPQAAAGIQNSLVGNAATGIGLNEGLLGQLQQFAGLQGGQNVNTLAPRPTLLSALQPIGQLASGLGQMGAARNMLQPQQGQSLSGAPNQLG